MIAVWTGGLANFQWWYTQEKRTNRENATSEDGQSLSVNDKPHICQLIDLGAISLHQPFTFYISAI